MIRLSLAFLIALSVAVPALAEPQKQKSNVAEQAILRLEQQWQDALLASDVAALDRIYAETIVYTHSNGSVDDKATYIGNIKSGATKYQTLVRDDIRVQVFGNSAIVTCHWKVQTMSRGNQINTDARYIHVYVKQSGVWRMVAHQSTRISS